MDVDARAAVRRVRESVRRFRDEPLVRMQAEARVLRMLRARQFHRFGRSSIVHRPMWLANTHKVDIGESTLVLHGIWLAVELPALGRDAPVVRIGDRVGIRPHCTISAAESIVIEDDVVISAFTTLVDSDHTYANGAPNIMHNPLVSTPIRVGRGTWIGERVAVLRGADIGTCCIIGANSVVRGAIPDYAIAVGSPARVVGSTRDQFERAGTLRPS
jgi:acetyltransferase-like isoleucine patch superfamily enzyme